MCNPENSETNGYGTVTKPVVYATVLKMLEFFVPKRIDQSLMGN